MYKSCCKCFLFRLPYGTITASLLAVCGLIICGSSLNKCTKIADKIFQDLLQKNYLWFNDLKAIYLITGVIICLIILFNLILGFAATGGKFPENPNQKQKRCSICCCSRNNNLNAAANNFLVKSMFILNYILYHCILIFTLFATAALLLTYLLTTLCDEGKYINTLQQSYNQPIINNFEGTNKMIDLRQFSPIFNLKSNETNLMLIKDVRLKKLCTDYSKQLFLNIILCFFGTLLLVIAFVNFLINISVNYAKISTKIKYRELMYLNSEMEMAAFVEN